MFIKRFKTRSCYYVYDVNINQILKIPVLVYKILGDWDKYQKSEILKKYFSSYSLKEIKNAIELICDIQEKENFFNPKTVESIGHDITRDSFENMLLNKLSDMVLKLTDNCNLNCNYCIRSSSLQPPSSNMSLETALEAINYLYEHSRKNEDPIRIYFYGGEALLNFEVLKKTVEYAKSKFDKDNINFLLTSNGIILDQKKIDYLFMHGFEVSVSFDGPKHFHDKHRITVAGEGSYDRVLANMKNLCRCYGEKSKEKLNILITLTPPYDVDAIESFLNKEQWIAEHFKVTANYVLQHDHFTQKFGVDAIAEKRKNSHPKLYLKYKNSVIKNKNAELPLCDSLFAGSFSKIYNRVLYTYPHKAYPLNGCCISGRLFVCCDGELKMCEKGYGIPNIGSLETGIDTDVVWNMMENYAKKSIRFCKNCWAIGLCSICFAKSHHKGEFSSTYKKEYCKSERANLLSSLRKFCSITEKNPDAFNHLKAREHDT